jgi:chorismate mutase/prephenate dehydratase
VKSLRARRARLDSVDRAIVKLLADRMALARDVARAKTASGARLRDRRREATLLARLGEYAEAAGLPPLAVERIFQEILHLSFHEQIAAAAAGRSASERVTVAYQGVPGAYSQWAAERLLSSRHLEAQTVGMRSFEAVARAVVEERVRYGILPVENTLAGSINETYDLLLRHALFIVGEEALPIDHCLAGVRRVPLHRLKRIYSHPQALAQCGAFLGELPGVEVHSFFDTAAAMQKVAADRDPTAAAIAGGHAARRYGLAVLKRHIADRPENLTRFLLVAREREPVPSGAAAKTSLLLAVKHEEGALLRALSVIHDHAINLTKLESRPRPGAPWQYYFYVDFEGNQRDRNVAAMLRQLGSRCRELRVLGSYVSRTVSEGQPVSAAEIEGRRRRTRTRATTGRRRT